MRALVLSGGASKGAFQVGVLQHLLGELECQYDILSGISVGAINALGLAMFPHGKEVESIEWIDNLWTNLKPENVYHHWGNLPGFLKYLGYLAALWKPSVYNSAPLSKLIKEHYNADLVRNSQKLLRIGAVSLNSGQHRTFTQDHPNIIKATLASSSFPGAFLPIKIEGEYYTDGGVREITPVKSAVRAGASEIDIIITSPSKQKSVDFGDDVNIVKLGPRIIDIMSEEIQEKDLQHFLQINRSIQEGAVIPGKKYIPIRIFRPSEKLVENSLDFSQKTIQSMIETGYQKAREVTSGNN